MKETIRMVCLSKIDGDVEMNAMLAAYTALGAAIILEVSGSTLLKLSQQFTKLWPSLGMLAPYARRGSKTATFHESAVVRLMRSIVATPTLKSRAMARMDFPSLSMALT